MGEFFATNTPDDALKAEIGIRPVQSQGAGKSSPFADRGPLSRRGLGAGAARGIRVWLGLETLDWPQTHRRPCPVQRLSHWRPDPLATCPTIDLRLVRPHIRVVNINGAAILIAWGLTMRTGLWMKCIYQLQNLAGTFITPV
ncbi:hypothetical protein ABIB48_000592 [Arthrobacter sp. UYCu511]|uniref:hypothetical protein n=1 Tax=Arthrobacter sp. UYCu511 TaxID=3156337 RepID=UPI003397CA94